MIHVLAVGLAALMLAACSEQDKAAGVSMSARTADAGRIARGAELYRAHCAACHGSHAQGAPNWQKPGPDGKYPAPPLDGSAHAWHHPKAVLRDVIRNGTLRIGGNMPPWRDKLNDAEIDVIIAWFQSLWPDALYAAWADMDRKAGR